MTSNAAAKFDDDLTAAIHALKESEKRLAVVTEALRKSEERATAGQLALEVMHEVRNPLEALGHLTFLTLQETDNSAKVQDYMLLAEEQMANLRRITNETLGFAHRWDKPRAVDLVALAEAAVRIHQRTIKEKQIHLVKDLPVEVIAEIHPGEMLQVVSNLIVNALEALPANGTLRLRLRKRQGKVDFLIADSGPGIPPDHNDAIFQPFFTTKGDHGTGLGLALSKRIVERHHGRIRVRSSIRPGKSGTAFKISLPVV